MITTLLLQTLLCSSGDALTSRPTTSAATTGTMVGIPPEQLQQLQDAAATTHEQIQQITDAVNAVRQAAETATDALKGQSFGSMLLGSTPRILWTTLNGATILAAGGMTAYLQFAPHSASAPAASGGNSSTTSAPSYYDRAAGFYDSLEPSDQRVTQATAALWIFGLGDSLVQYCVTKTNDLKETLQNGPFETGEMEREPTAAVDFFKEVKQVVVGTGEDEVIMTLAAFKKRSGFDAKNPFAKEAFAVILESGDKVLITEDGKRTDQLPSATDD